MTKAAAMIEARAPGPYRIGMILGSGLSPVADAVDDAIRIPYRDLTGFPHSGVTGHRGELVLGRMSGLAVAVLSGRAHYYERGDAGAMRTPIETLKALGCDTVILTNAAGSMNEAAGPGGLMMIADHINLAGANPLVGAGEGTDARFVGLTEAYDPDLRARFRKAAEAEGIALPEGVYAWFSGPSFETPAEIRAARMLGADLVGMSTVPEVILARFLGLRVAAISTVTNLAAGMTGAELSHEDTKQNAPRGAEKLARLIPRAIRDL